MIPVLVEASLRVLGIAVVVWLVLGALRVRLGAARHAAWTAVLAVMVGAPILVWSGAALPAVIPRLPNVERVVSLGSPDRVAVAPPPRVEALAATAVRPPFAATDARSVAPSVDPEPTHSPGSMVTLIWLGGAMLQMALMLFGWSRARSVLAFAGPVDAKRLPTVVTAPVWESGAVLVPVAVGVVRPAIVLPTNWPTWSQEDLVAVLVHEQAHIVRRDLLVLFLARFNRALYWFHPLAWFLQSAIARSSEEACDDAVLRRTQGHPGYAALLVNMASLVQRASGRVRWTTVGIGGGRLESRIDRVLAGEAGRPLPRWRGLLLGSALVATVTAGIGCQQQPAALKPNPEYEARMLASQALWEHLKGIDTLSRDEVDALEAEVAAAPDDLKKVERLLSFYYFHGQKMFGWNEMVARRRPHFLRVIERYPASNIANRTLVRAHDPQGYDAAAAVWSRHVEKADATATVLGNAASFFLASDKPRAEALLKRALALDPDGPQPRLAASVYTPSWRQRLGTLYAQAIVGANDDTLGNVVRSFSPAEAAGAFASVARHTLESTDDVEILNAAGSYLMMNATSVGGGKLPFEPRALGSTYVDRSLSLAPGSETARRLQRWNANAARQARVSRLIRQLRTDATVWEGLEIAERSAVSGDVATFLVMRGEGTEGTDPAQQAKTYALARTIASDALSQAGRIAAADPVVLFQCHMVLGQLALVDGDRRSAVEHLRAAVEPTAALDSDSVQFAFRLPIYLLNVGERESVIAFYERLAELDPRRRQRWLADANAIRGGFMTETYQSVFVGRAVAAATN